MVASDNPVFGRRVPERDDLPAHGREAAPVQKESTAFYGTRTASSAGSWRPWIRRSRVSGVCPSGSAKLFDVPELQKAHDHNPANDAYTIAFDQQVLLAIRERRIVERDALQVGAKKPRVSP